MMPSLSGHSPHGWSIPALNAGRAQEHQTLYSGVVRHGVRRAKAQLKSLLEDRFTSQNRVDKHLRALQTAQAFAQPLLEAALNAAGFTLP